MIFIGLYFLSHRIRHRRRPITVVDLVPVLVRDGDRIYKGIIDTRDPYMLIARGLYFHRNDVHRKLVRCDLVQWPVCVCLCLNEYFTDPMYSGYIRRNTDIYGDYYISMPFPSPNRLLWLSAQINNNLVITTGYYEDMITLRPNLLNLSTIEIRGLESFFLDVLIEDRVRRV